MELTWLDLGKNVSLIKFKPTPIHNLVPLDPTRANSSQVGGQTIPNSIEVVNLARVGLRWEDHMTRALSIIPVLPIARKAS